MSSKVLFHRLWALPEVRSVRDDRNPRETLIREADKGVPEILTPGRALPSIFEGRVFKLPWKCVQEGPDPCWLLYFSRPRIDRLIESVQTKRGFEPMEHRTIFVAKHIT